MSLQVMVITKSYLGQVKPADMEFGERMLVKFIHTLEDAPRKPNVICFYTEGVTLACEGSPVLSSLAGLQDAGVKLVLCKTCLEYFGILDKVRVGEVGGMDTIVSQLTTADVVITP